MVAEVVPDTGKMGTDRDAQFGEEVARADARTHERARTA